MKLFKVLRKAAGNLFYFIILAIYPRLSWLEITLSHSTEKKISPTYVSHFIIHILKNLSISLSKILHQNTLIDIEFLHISFYLSYVFRYHSPDY